MLKMKQYFQAQTDLLHILALTQGLSYSTLASSKNETSDFTQLQRSEIVSFPLAGSPANKYLMFRTIKALPKPRLQKENRAADDPQASGTERRSFDQMNKKIVNDVPLNTITDIEFQSKLIKFSSFNVTSACKVIYCVEFLFIR